MLFSSWLKRAQFSRAASEDNWTAKYKPLLGLPVRGYAKKVRNHRDTEDTEEGLENGLCAALRLSALCVFKLVP